MSIVDITNAGSSIASTAKSTSNRNFLGRQIAKVENFADNNSIVFAGEEKYTYRQMGADIERVASLLSVLGVEKGDKVAILSTNMPNWGVSFFAISVLGAVAVPILPDFHENEIKTIIEHSEAKVIFVAASLFGTLGPDTRKLAARAGAHWQYE